MGTAEINSEVTYNFLACTYIKNMSENTEKIFETTLKKYVSPIEGGYHKKLDTYDIIIAD